SEGWADQTRLLRRHRFGKPTPQRSFFAPGVLLTPPPVAGRRLTRVIGGAALILAAWPAWWFTGVLAGTPPPVVLVGGVAATGWASLVCLLGHRRHETPRVILATFFWGAIVASYVSAHVNDALLVRVGSGGGDLVPVLLAPLVEEGAKAGALVAAL